jgi:hypothetical protein
MIEYSANEVATLCRARTETHEMAAELLKALKQIAQIEGEVDAAANNRVVGIARAAIAKAEGRQE